MWSVGLDDGICEQVDDLRHEYVTDHFANLDGSIDSYERCVRCGSVAPGEIYAAEDAARPEL